MVVDLLPRAVALRHDTSQEIARGAYNREMRICGVSPMATPRRFSR
jgi:hypothetical protein